MIVDLFAGPGGWDQGLADAGVHDTAGLEIDQDACVTATAAGHLRIRADVAAYPTAAFDDVEGLVGSPPCQAWSLAGRGAGRNAADRLLEHVAACADGWVEPAADLCHDDVRADLTLQPVKWIDQLRPRWVALEQVPPVLPMWHAIAALLRRWGYHADALILNAADFGVPQTRRRAFLIARRDGAVSWPEPTHFDPQQGLTLFGSPWRSLAEAIGWDRGDHDGWTVRTGMNTMKHSRDNQDMIPYERPIARPSPTLDAKVGSAWKFAPPDGHSSAPQRWKVGRQDAVRIPGTAEALRLSAPQAGVLQSFPVDYPWSGAKNSQFRQIGNAVPPRLAAAVVRDLISSRQQAAA